MVNYEIKLIGKTLFKNKWQVIKNGLVLFAGTL